MKVHELITILSKLDQLAVVTVDSDDHSYQEISYIDNEIACKEGKYYGSIWEETKHLPKVSVVIIKV
jgi:hypothetical protein